MAQTLEYPMFSPYPKAKLYRRFTGDVPIKLKDNDIIVIQDNRYVYVDNITWIDTADSNDVDEQPIDGLLVPNTYLTIRTNSLEKFVCGDIIELPQDSPFGGLWSVQSGATAKHIFTPQPIQTYQYLPLSSMG